MMRKGRLDEIFFIDLPGRARLGRRSSDFTSSGEPKTPAAFGLASLAEASAGFSGAEIEQAIVSATLRRPRRLRVPLDTAGLLVALRSTRPLSVVRAEPIAALRAWAAGRCVPA